MVNELRKLLNGPGRSAYITGVVAVALLTAAALHWIGLGAAIVVLLAASVSHLATSFANVEKRVSAWSRDYLKSQRAQSSHGQNLARLIETIDTAAIFLDPEGMVEASSRAARELFPQLAAGRSLAAAVRNPDLLAAAAETARTGQPRALEVLERRPFSRRLAVSVAAVSEESASSGAKSVLLQFRDLTEQDRLAQMRSDFIANASHELRTPLASLKGFIETLRGPAKNDSAARDRFLGIMETQAARMTRILDDLLSLSRIEMRVHLAPEGEAELSSILGTVTKSLEPLADEARIALQFAPEASNYLVRGDRDELEQVFQNLIHNAIKYGREGGNVAVTISRLNQRDGARIAVAVADDGPGIAEEHLPRLTERFYRVDTATSRERGGTGLGLAIVKHILTRHRAELKIESKLGQGSTFTVIVPAKDIPKD